MRNRLRSQNCGEYFCSGIHLINLICQRNLQMLRLHKEETRHIAACQGDVWLQEVRDITYNISVHRRLQVRPCEFYSFSKDIQNAWTWIIRLKPWFRLQKDGSHWCWLAISGRLRPKIVSNWNLYWSFWICIPPCYVTTSCSWPMIVCCKRLNLCKCSCRRWEIIVSLPPKLHTDLNTHTQKDILSTFRHRSSVTFNHLNLFVMEPWPLLLLTLVAVFSTAHL